MEVKVLCFGSEILEGDDTAVRICDILKGALPRVEFSFCRDPFEILEHEGEVLVLDVVKNLDRVDFVSIDLLDKKKMYTLHDFDIGFFLKLASRIGRTNVRVLGVPYGSRAEDAAKEVRRLLTRSRGPR